MKSRQSGVALAIVVWFIAGMSLLVAGIVAHARVDTRTTQIHLAQAKATAAGDGAIHLAMVQRRQGYKSSGQGPEVSESRHRLGDVDVVVRIYPADGFINVSSASQGVLAALFRVAGGLAPGDANYVAENVVKWRGGGDRSNRSRSRRGEGHKFHSLEDMLRVEGVSRSLLDDIRDFTVAGSWAQGSTSWNAAPEDMMAILKAIDPGKAGQAAKRRSASARTSEKRGGGSSGAYRADAHVNYGGRNWLRRRWISADGTAVGGLPWRVVRTEAPRVVAG
jgi:general secretion pathway protein K